MPKELPFARGSTYGDGKVVTSGEGEHLLGNIYPVQDTVHSTNAVIYLRAVRNASGARVTIKRRFAPFAGTTSKWMGRQFVGLARAVEGAVGKPFDDAYSTSTYLTTNDIGYVVEEGWCDVMNTSETTSHSQHDPVVMSPMGKCSDLGARTSFYIVGFYNADVSTEGAHTTIWVKGGLGDFTTKLGNA